MQYEALIKKAYKAFNERNIDEALSTTLPDVHWPNGWEGGYIDGQDEVKKYWTRQWAEINPKVEPLAFAERQDGTIEVEVHQLVKELDGTLIFDGKIKHIYTFKQGLISAMQIEK